jgi:hypothetical protein
MTTIESLTIDCIKPMRLDYANIEFNHLNLLTGMNNTGKSFMLKVVYALTISLRILYSNYNNLLQVKEEVCKHVFDSTFSNQDFTGKFLVTLSNSLIFSVDMKDGIVITVEISNPNNITDIPSIVYMSSQMRLFTSMEYYLQARKRVNNDPNKLLSEFKLYDIEAVEKFIAKCPIKLKPELFLSEHDAKDASTLSVDLDECKFHINYTTGEKRDMSYFGSGQQAWLNMQITAMLQ